MKRALILLLVIIGIISIVLLYFGVSHLLTSISIHLLLFIGISKLIQVFYSSWRSSNYRITFWSIFVGVILIELTLRFVTQNHLSYSERNGSLWYIDPFNNKLASIYRYKLHNDAGLMLHNPNSCRTNNKSEFEFEHCYNDVGIRDNTYAKTDLDSNLVILTIGDSFTEGVGAPQDSTWPSLLASNINNEYYGITVINCGQDGSDLVYEWYKLKTKLINFYNPDIVILALNNSDIQDLIFRGGTERFVNKKRTKYRLGPWWSYIYSFSHVTRLIIHDFFNIEWHYLTQSQYKNEANLSKGLIKETIEKVFMNLADENRFKFMVVFTPMYYEVKDENFLLQDVYNDINVSDSLFTKISLMATFLKIKSDDNLSSYYWPIDLHCRSIGYKVWAEQIHQELEKKQWLTINKRH